MSDWQIVVITVLVPLLITSGIPFLSDRLKAKREERKAANEGRVSDAEIGAKLRDELRGEIERLNEENRDLRGRVGTLEDWVARLELAMRQRAPDAFEQLRKDYDREAANDG